MDWLHLWESGSSVTPWSNPTQRTSFSFGYQAGEGPQWQRNSEVERIWKEKSPKSMAAVFLHSANTYRHLEGSRPVLGKHKNHSMSLLPWKSHWFGPWGCRRRMSSGKESIAAVPNLFWCACVLSHFSPVRLCVTLGTVTRQVPLSMGFSRQEYWSRLLCPPPGDLPDPGIKPTYLMSTCIGRLVIYQ